MKTRGTKKRDTAVLAAMMLLFAACASAPQPEQTAPVQNPLAGITVPPAPENSPNKKRLLNYLNDQYGKSIISGQMDTAWTVSKQVSMIPRVFADTGKYPAIMGFDMLQMHVNNAPFLGGREQVNKAIEWWEGRNDGITVLPNRPDIHGIVTICWHWRAGPEEEFNTDKTKFRIPWKDGKLNKESAEFVEIVGHLDKLALRFAVLKEKDIPVLWRPLHEASGGWFWWGASGRKPYIALWEFMYEYLVCVKQLNNLIWVWNGDSAAWCPNPDTIDIVGRDMYLQSYASQKQEFELSKGWVPGRKSIVALTENGRIPDPDLCIKDEAMWSYFMTWADRGDSLPGQDHLDNYWTGELINTQAHKMKVYHHPAVITLDKLPDLTAYRLK